MPTPARPTTLAFALVATLAGWPAQAQWRQGLPRPLPPPSGTGRLRNTAQGMCLDVDGWAAHGNSSALLWACNGDPDHVWTFTPGGELRNTLNGTCLDAAGYDGAQGANVDVYRCESLDDQRWTLIPRGRGAFELRNNKSGLCLDAPGQDGAQGRHLLLWACDGGPDQRWSFEPYAPPPPPRPAPQQPQRELPPPAYPPPPPAEARRERPRPMDERAFRALVGAVRNESFSERQLTVIQQAAAQNYFRVGQVKALIDLVSFSGPKLRVLELGAPRLVDPENAFAVYDAFTFSADKEKAQEILRRNGV